MVYFNGPAPQDSVLDHPRVALRPIGSGPTRGFLWQQLRLPRAARADRLQVFFAPAYTCPLSLDLPRVTTVHDVSFFSWPHDQGLHVNAWMRLLCAASVRASSRVLTVSEFGRRELVSLFPDAGGRVVTTVLGPDDDLPPPVSRREARARLGLEGLRVLSVGSIFNRRRLPVLLEAIAGLRRAGLPVALDVVGDNRTTPRMDFERLARSLGIRAAVDFAGFVPERELALRYAAADAFVFLSEYEGFGLTPLEAMVRGLPVVTSTRPSLGELFAGGAQLVDPADANAVAAALRPLLTEGAVRDTWIARAREHARRFSWAEAAENTLRALQQAAR